MLPSVTKWQEESFTLVRGAKFRNLTIIPEQCKATLDVADNNVGWIPFAQHADTIDTIIAAKQDPQLHSATEFCISASPNRSNAPCVAFSQVLRATPTVFH